jgi:hypothetical protein
VILKLLAESTEEQILDGDELIDVLQSSKKTSTDIEQRIKDSVILEAEINDTRN